MKNLFGGTEAKIVQYVDQVFRPEDVILKQIRERADREGIPSIQIGKMDGLHLEVLTRAIGAKKAVEIGTLAGYSGVCILRGLGPDGKLYTFELEGSRAKVAQESFQKAGFAEQVEIFVGPALKELPKISNFGPFDLVFIDADKENYPQYLKWAIQNLRVGGVILADNTFGWGMIADEDIESPEDELAVKSLREFNRMVSEDPRFRSTILPTGEGLTLAVKIAS